MARPAKAISAKTAKISKEETENRLAVEDCLRGGKDKLIPPLYLTEDQENIFYYIMEELSEANILGNLDLYILSQTAICIDRIQKLERMINEDPELITKNSFMAGKDKYSKDFFRCCSELCLSPQSRAKLSIAAVKPGQDKKKTLMDMINDDEDEDE